MKYWDIISTANANLRKSKLRTLLTISAVFIGALTLMLTSGVGAGLRSYVEEQVNAVGAKDVLIIQAASDGSENPISSDDNPKEYDPNARPQSAFGGAVLQASDIEKIRGVQGIKQVIPLYAINAEYITSGEKKFQGQLTQAVENVKQPLLTGRLTNVNGPDAEVTLPSGFVGPLGLGDNNSALGKKVTFGFKDAGGNLFTKEATVVGIQEKSLINGNDITGNLTLVRGAFDESTQGIPDFQRNQYQVAFAQFDSTYSKEQLASLKQTLKDKGYSAATLDDQLGIIRNVINGITTFLNIFAGIALVAATFGIINTLFMAVQERTREIGLMKALGMSRGKIFALFSFEAILIGFWGAIIALGIANILGRIASHFASTTIFKDFEGLELFSFPFGQMLSIILLIMFIAFLAGAIPARRASRLDPIEALRYE